MIDLGVFSSTVEHEAVYDHPPDRVWRALTESELLGAWLMENDLDRVAVGETFEFTSDPIPPFWDGTVRCEVLEVDRPRHLKISWWGGGANPETTVTWRLDPVGDGSESDQAERTRLRVTQEGLDGVRGLMMKFGMRGGWDTMYHETLPAVLDRLASGDPIPGQDARAECGDTTAGE